MLKNYFHSALRNLTNQKLFTLINISGLAIGLASCILIFLFINHEFSYDKEFNDLDRLFRIEATANIPGQSSNESPNFFGTTFDLLPNEFAEIESIIRAQQRPGTVIDGTRFTDETFLTVDPGFLVVFNFPMLEGDAKTSLATPNSIVLTEEKARQHLGPPPWLGKTMQIDETFERDMVVMGIIETLPGNTHFEIDFLVPIDQRVYEAAGANGITDLNRWNGLPFRVYVKLQDGHNGNLLATGLSDWVDRHFPDRIRTLVGISGSALFTPRLMPVRDIHMFSPVQFDFRPRGNLTTIYSFIGIAALILVIASINFVNLAMATSTLRAKEAALRKVMGANRRQLFVQFELESMLVAGFAMVLGVALALFVLPAFADFTLREINLDALFQPLIIFSMLALTLIVGLLAGIYPAFVVSGFRPSRVLQSNRSEMSGSARLRTTLVLMQFAISATLIIVTTLMFVQTNYVRSMDRGYDNAYKLVIRGLFEQRIGNVAETVRDEIARVPGVTKVSLSSFAPGDFVNTGLSLKVPGVADRIIIFYRSVYPAFFEQFQIEPIAGRLLEESRVVDRATFQNRPGNWESQTVNVVVNELAAKELGYTTPDEAIGGVFYRGPENQIEMVIVGVLPNVHFGSPRADLDSEIMMYAPDQTNNLLVTYQPDREQSVRKAIDAKLRELLPMLQPEVLHLQENIAQQYQEESIQSTLLARFSALAILIACMGLFGLASYTATRRTKEIGIRKVMGASTPQIVLLLLKQFTIPVVAANLIAWPVSWYVIQTWMQGFNHQISLTFWFLAASILAIGLTLLLAWCTVASHTLRVASTNPAIALRHT